jgi:cytochrome bd-type quinol oxidase subunit 2
MLGGLITGFQDDLWSHLFSALIGFCLIAADCLLGASWLIMKTEGALQRKAVQWAWSSLWLTALGIGVPFAGTVGVMLLSFYGLGYSLFPWLVIDQITIWQSAGSPEALMVIFYGVAVVLPVIIGYTVFAYRVFWGKSTALVY